MKRYFIALLFVCFLFTIPSLQIQVYAENPAIYKAPISIDDQPIMTEYMLKDGHLLVPALFLKNTGLFVDYNEKYQSIVFKKTGELFAFGIGKKYSDEYDRNTGKWTRGKLATETMQIDGKVFVPLIDVATRTGMNVRYDSNAGKTYVTSNIPVTPNVIYKGSSSQKLAALTFDDGPDGKYTPMILDILKEKDVPATFFVMGQQVERFPKMLNRIEGEGHAIANHTWKHPDLRTKWSSDVKDEITTTQKEIKKVVGKSSDLFRPPYGEVTKADVKLLNDLGLRNILWSVDTEDYNGPSADEIMETVRREMSPGGILLQHNFQSSSSTLDGTVEALPRIIDELREEGYEFVTVQTLLER